MKKLILLFLIIFLGLSFGFAENLQENHQEEQREFIVQVPFFDEIDLYSFSLPALTVIAGLLDWFNPCALFILLFLLSILLTSWDRKRLIILWSTFIIASWIAYLWILSFLLFSMQSIPQYYRSYFQLFIWIMAIAFWIASLYKFWKEKNWCSVMWEKRRNYFFNKIKAAIEQKSLIISMIWITLIAFAINFFEMFCTAGIPITYIAILEAQWYTWWVNLIYLLAYIFFFLLDHFIIFAIAVSTMTLVWISTKFKKWTSLIWGLLMLALWLIIMFRPERIMFG